MRPSPFSSVAQSLVLVIIGLVLMAYVIYRTFSIALCGAFLVCFGSPLPPLSNTFLLREWLGHVSIILLIVCAIPMFIMIVLIYNRQDWDMIGALRIAALFVAGHGVAAIASMFTYGNEVYHIISAALVMAALTVVAARVLFTDNDEFRQGTFIAVLGLVSLLSAVPYVLSFAT